MNCLLTDAILKTVSGLTEVFCENICHAVAGRLDDVTVLDDGERKARNSLCLFISALMKSSVLSDCAKTLAVSESTTREKAWVCVA